MPEVTLERARLRALDTPTREALLALPLGDDSFMRAALLEPPGRAMCWLARDDDQPIGWSLLRWYSPDIRGVSVAYLNVFVAQAWRRSDLGRALLRMSLDHAAEQGMRAVVHGTTAAQFDFYRASGVPERDILRAPFPRTYWEHYRFVKRMGLLG